MFLSYWDNSTKVVNELRNFLKECDVLANNRPFDFGAGPAPGILNIFTIAGGAVVRILSVHLS